MADYLSQGEAPASYVDLAAEAGVSRKALYELLKNPAAVAWVAANSLGTRAADAAVGLVHARLLHLALTTRSPAVLELYLKRFDSDYRRDSGGIHVHTDNALFQTIQSMSTSELEAFLRQRRRKQGVHDDDDPAEPRS